MFAFALRQLGRFGVGVLGAAVATAAISALAAPHAPGLWPFLKATGERLFAFAQLDFGRSTISGMSAAGELAQRLPATLAIVTAGSAVAILVGAPLGALFGAGPVRRAVAPLMLVVAAAPVFCAGLALAYGAHLLNWPVSVNAPVALDTPIFSLAAPAWQLALPPVLTVGLSGAAAIQLAIRRAAAQLAHAPFRTGLRRLGLSAFEIERAYVLPQIVAGLFASAGEIVLALLSAAVVAEWVFHRPGAADLFVKAVALHDWNMAALVLFVFVFLYFVAELVGRLLAYTLANEGAQ